MIDFGTAIGVILLVFLATGIVLVSWGLRGRVVSRGPHCKKCKFDLSGSKGEFDRARKLVIAARNEREPPRCPECGSQLSIPRTIVFTLRRKRWVLVVVGALLVSLPVVAMMNPGTSRRLTMAAARNAPDSVVVVISERPRNHAFAQELRDRIRAGTLSSEALRVVIQRSLDDARKVGRTRPSQLPILFWDLADAGAFTSEEVFSVIGEPTVSFDMPARVREHTPACLFVRVVLPPYVAQGSLGFELESAPADATDSGKLKGLQGFRRGSGFFRPMDSRNVAERVYELDPRPPVVMPESSVELPYRDVHVRTNLLITHGRAVIARVEGVRFDRRQDVIESDERLVVLDMDPAANAAAKAAFADVALTRDGSEENKDAQLTFHWSRDRGESPLCYRIERRPAGKPDAWPLFTIVIPPTNYRCSGGECTTRAMVITPKTELPAAIDLIFEPSVRGAEEVFRRDARYSSIPGEAFTIENVPIR